MSYFNIVCDVCGRGVQGITWVNGMKFCAKCYQETFENKMVFTNETGKFVDLLNTEMYELKISNLEHKLEEKDQRIAELKQQLAEKEKAIDNLMNGTSMLINKSLNHNQDKISFCVEQLEKVKDKIKKLPCAMTLTTSAFEQIYKVDATRQIDNQIASLKKGVRK